MSLHRIKQKLEDRATLLSALLPLLAALVQRLLRLHDVARRRLGRSRGILARGGQLLLQAGVLLFQFGNVLCQMLAVQARACFPQLQWAKRYPSLAVRTRSTDYLPNAEFWPFLGGRLT
jgi:hypothetical protein